MSQTKSNPSKEIALDDVLAMASPQMQQRVRRNRKLTDAQVLAWMKATEPNKEKPTMSQTETDLTALIAEGRQMHRNACDIDATMERGPAIARAGLGDWMLEHLPAILDAAQRAGQAELMGEGLGETIRQMQAEAMRNGQENTDLRLKLLRAETLPLPYEVEYVRGVEAERDSLRRQWEHHAGQLADENERLATELADLREKHTDVQFALLHTQDRWRGLPLMLDTMPRQDVDAYIQEAIEELDKPLPADSEAKTLAAQLARAREALLAYEEISIDGGPDKPNAARIRELLPIIETGLKEARAALSETGPEEGATDEG